MLTQETQNDAQRLRVAQGINKKLSKLKRCLAPFGNHGLGDREVKPGSGQRATIGPKMAKKAPAICSRKGLPVTSYAIGIHQGSLRG